MKSFFILPLALLASMVFADDAQDVSIDKPFARAAMQQQRNSAAFMQITNNSENTAIIYAKSPVADIVELHTHINDNGVMRMRKIKQIDLPAKKSVSLQPGGLHVMLLGLNRDLNPGDQIDLSLGFADGSEKSLKIPVQKMMMHNKKGMKAHKMDDNSKPAMMNH